MQVVGRTMSWVLVVILGCLLTWALYNVNPLHLNLFIFGKFKLSDQAVLLILASREDTFKGH